MSTDLTTLDKEKHKCSQADQSKIEDESQVANICPHIESCHWRANIVWISIRRTIKIAITNYPCFCIIRKDTRGVTFPAAPRPRE